MTLRELLERERDRAADAAAESYWGPKEDLEEEERNNFDAEKSQYRDGFNHALELLMPLVVAHEVISDNAEIAGVNVDTEVARLALNKLKAKLEQVMAADKDCYD
jgi:hypothetical protein